MGTTRLALPAPNNTIKNDAPPQLLHLAKAAIFAGFHEVELGFDYLGADTPSPIGWLLYLTKRDVGTMYRLNGNKHVIKDKNAIDQRIQLRVTARRKGLVGDGTYHDAEAYVGGKNPYWDADRILKWINTDHRLAQKERDLLNLGADGKLISDEAAQVAYDRLEAAYLNGWAATHELKADMAFSFPEMLKDGKPAVGDISFHIEAFNNFYNIDDHPQRRSAGGKLNASHRLLFLDGHTAQPTSDSMLFSQEHSENVESGNADNFEESPYHRAVNNTAPWFVRVAGMIEDNEETQTDGYWAFAPEASADSDWKPLRA